MRLRVALLLLASVALAVPTPAHGARKPKAPDVVRFRARAGASLLVHGTYPRVPSSCVDPYRPVLHERYRGTIEVRRSDDGSLYLIGELGFEDYLKGIAEVPRDWPMAALEAQVVAARTYALVRLARTEATGYDLCATDACQVYVGMGVERGPWGDRWRRAVDATAGRVLLYHGEPAETLYFSTSNGRTLPNEKVFGTSPVPYLRSVKEEDDGASPLSRWEVRIPFGDLAPFLTRSGGWPGGPIRRVSSAGEDRIRFQGAHRLVLDRDGLRDALNASAACLEPDRYPPTERDGYQLPQTVPSHWYHARTDGHTLVLAGRGWGHGVGMVQWGAYGKAKRGLSYAEILGAYYRGLHPEHVNTPGPIRVLLADGLTSVAVAPGGDVHVGGVARAPESPWRVNGGRRLRLRHGPAPRPLLHARRFSGPGTAVANEPYPGTLRLSDDANVRLEFLHGGEVAGATPWRPFEEGRVRLRDVPVPVGAGRYEVRLVASNGVDTVHTDARTVKVTGSAPPSPTGTAAGAPGSRRTPIVPVAIGAGILVVLAAALALTLRLRRGTHGG